MFDRFAVPLTGAFLLAAAPALAQSPPPAEAPRFAVGTVVGTRGAGLDLQYAWSDRVVLRGSVDALAWTVDGNHRGFDYVNEVSAKTVGGFVDIHPFSNGWMVTGGAYLSEPDIDVSAKPRRTVRLGGANFTPAQVGELKGGIVVNGAAPFLGVGYDATFSRNDRWGVRMVAGATFTGTPHVSLTSRGGTLSTNRAFQTRVAAEVRDLQADIADYSVFPVVQLGLNYRF